MQNLLAVQEYKTTLSFRLSEALKAEILDEAEQSEMTTSRYVELLLENRGCPDSPAAIKCEALEERLDELEAENKMLRSALVQQKVAAIEAGKLTEAFRAIGLDHFDESSFEQINLDFQELEKSYPNRRRFEIIAAALNCAVESEESYFSQLLSTYWER